MNRPKLPDILPEPPIELKQHSARLLERIRAKISDDGPISFAQFMEMALYEPGLGYYSAGLHKFGAEGDFVTAPELGQVFGACLARQIAQVGAELGDFDILEIGAGSGRLAAQLISELSERSSVPSSSGKGRRPCPGPTPRRERCAYSILETSADLREAQGRTIERDAPECLKGVKWLDRPPRESWRGIILANEVVDALPVERFRVKGGAIRQVCVTAVDGGLGFTERAAPRELEDAVRALGALPDGYCSEISPRLAPWLESVTAALEHGLALFIDYGYPRHEYYLPERSDGTLIAHYRHRAHGDLLRFPGLQDLTAFVDFTALAEAGAAAGLEVLGYTSQAMFLMACGVDEVLDARRSGDAERDMAVNNEVRRLVLPGMMGEKFQVMALGRNWPESAPLRGFTFRDLRHRL